jgi:hypothetical protein
LQEKFNGLSAIEEKIVTQNFIGVYSIQSVIGIAARSLSRLGTPAAFTTAALTAAILLMTSTAQAAFFTPGQFDVTPSGAASYTIPISVPPGTAGMAPSLALNYNSQGGNGLMGMGWSLSGLSAITRCPKTLIQDGVKSGVNYTATDSFCLDGQRLVAIAGAYGANGTEYRTEGESFSKIVSYGSNGYGPTWFKVWTKSGQSIELGNTVDSTIEAQGKVAIRVWAVNKISDTKGNYLTVSYVEANVNGEYYPQRIDYTGNMTTGLLPYNSVQFIYATRPDITPMYDGGSLLKNTRRLTNVQTYAQVDGSNAIVKDYRLTYDVSAATQRSRITQVQECEGSGASCLSATTLNQSDSAQSAAFKSTAGVGAIPLQLSNNTIGFQLGDFNADGKTDILRWGNLATNNAVFLSDGAGGFNQASSFNLTGVNLQLSNTIGFQLSDFDGDGKSDILRFGTSSANNALYLSSDNGGFNQAGNFNLVDSRLAMPVSVTKIGTANWVLVPYTRNYNCMAGTTYVGAVQLRETTNLVTVVGGVLHAPLNNPYKPPAGVTGKFLQLGKANAFFCPDAYSYSCPSNYTLSGSICNPSVDASAQLYSSTIGIQLGDFNGDGRTDILKWSDATAGNAVFLSNGDGSFTQSASFNLNNTYLGHSNRTVGVALGDFNGDGKTDILRWWDAYQSNAVFLSNGDGSFTQSASFNLNNTYLGHSNRTVGVALGDFNGDGKTDILRWWDTYQSNALFLSNGDGSFTQLASFNLNNTTLGHSNGTVGVALGDFNSDGKTDILRWWDAYQSNAAFLSNGDGSFTQSAAFNLNNTYLRISNNTIGFQLGDFNGDGRADILRGGDNYTDNALYTTAAPIVDQLSSVTNGLGATTTITYKPLTDGTVYTKDSTGIYPATDIQAPMYVVSSVSSSNGIGGTYSSTYNYVGAKSHLTGGGFLGFRETANTDVKTGIISTTTYHQDYPYHGLPLTAEKRTATGVVLNNVSNTWTSSGNAAWSAQYHAPQLTQSVESSYELSGGLISTVTTNTVYDGYGNPTAITVSTPDGYSKTTTNTYQEPDLLRWYLGRLTSATVSSTKP